MSRTPQDEKGGEIMRLQEACKHQRWAHVIRRTMKCQDCGKEWECVHPRRRYVNLGSMGTMQCPDCFDLELGTTWPPVPK